MRNRFGEARWRKRHRDVERSCGDERWQMWSQFEWTGGSGEDVNPVAEGPMNGAVYRRE